MQARKAVTALGVLGAALVMAAPALAQGQAQAQAHAPAQAKAAAACTVALTPTALTAQPDPLQVKAVLSQAIGPVAAAKIQEENSGIDIALGEAPAPAAAAPAAAAPAQSSSAAPAGAKPAAAGPSPTAQPAPAAAAGPAAEDQPAAAGQALDLLFSTATAKAGDWTLTLAGAHGTCSGKVHVDAAAPKK